MKSKPPPLRQIRTTVSAPASVGASKLRLEVATGNPHPYTGEAMGSANLQHALEERKFKGY